MTPLLRRFHRLFGFLLAVPLFFWMLTGILFNVKYRYAEAYEPLRLLVKSSDVPWDEARLSPAELVHRGIFDTGAKLGLLSHPSNRPAYVGSKAKKPVVIDAATGMEIVPAAENEARRWAQAAISGSPNAYRYGNVTAVHEVMRFSPLTGVSDPAFDLSYSGGKTVRIDRLTGEISQTGRLNDWIDFTYRIHYLQWTPWKPVNIALVLIAAPLAFALALSGLRMFFRAG